MTNLLLVLHEADIGIEAVFAIAKQQRLWGRSTAIEFSGTVREVLGSCHSLDVTVDGFSALSIQRIIKTTRPPRKRRPKKKRPEKDGSLVPHHLKPPIPERGKQWDRRKTKPKNESGKGEKEKEKGEEAEDELELPIPPEELVSPFMRPDGSPDLSLCRDTYMSAEEIAARKELSTKKMMEVRYRDPVQQGANTGN